MKKTWTYINQIFFFALMLFSVSYGQVLILQPQSGYVSELNHLTIVAAGRSGGEVTLFVNDTEMAKGEIRDDGKYDFINIEVPSGPTEIKVIAKGSGDKIYSSVQQIHVKGDPFEIMTIPEKIELPADGQSVQNLELKIYDKWGYAITLLKLATLKLEKGKILESDLDQSSKGHQLSIQGGSLECQIQADEIPGKYFLEVEIGGLIKQIPVKYFTPSEPIMLVGYTNGTLIGKGSHPENQEVDDFMGLDNKKTISSTKNMSMLARSALYIRGTIFDQYQLTANYDSGKIEDDQLFQDDDPYEQYMIYGDDSQLEYNAPTSSSLYMNIAREQSYLTFGDFNTGFQSTELAAYNRSLNGVLSSIENDNHKVIGFLSKTSREMMLDEIRGSGISGYYMLSSTDITRLSEVIVLETRDLYHSEQILKRTRLSRYIDYSIDYENGYLMFKQPVPSSDSGGNPIYIMAYYEHMGDHGSTLVGGLRIEGSIADRFQFGSTLIAEEETGDNYYLYGVDTKLPLTSWLAVSGEYASSSTPSGIGASSKGNAFNIGMKLKPLNQLTFENYYREVDNNFVNQSQSGSASERGSKKYGLSGSYRMKNLGELSSEFYRQFNHISDPSEEHVEVSSINYSKNLGEQYKFSLGYQNSMKEQRSASGTFDDLKSSSIISQVQYKISEKTNTHVEYNYNLRDDKNIRPSYLQFGLDFSITPRVDIFFERSLIQGNQQADETILGFESKVKENTSLSAKYEIGGALGKDRSRAIVALQNKWNVTEDLTINFSLESTANIDSFQTPVKEHNAFSCAFEYFPMEPRKLSGKFEDMNDKTTQRNLYNLNGAFKIYQGISFILKSEYSNIKFKNYESENITVGKYRIGLAHRPEKYDFINSLVKFEYITDKNSHVQPIIESNRLIFSVHSYYQPLKHLGFGGKYARRSIIDRQGEHYDDNSLTDYFMIRTEWQWTDDWSMAFDLRLILVHNTGEVKSGNAAEFNYVLKKNMQLGIGYIFNYYNDPDFALLDYSNNRIYLNMNVKFSEDMFNWK